MALKIVACNVIYLPKSQDTLVVLDTSSDRLHAGTLFPDTTDKKDILSSAGTYLAQHLGGASLVDTWKPERVANAAANTFFREYPELHAEFFERFMKSLQEAKKHSPYIVE
jgi:hypothetical protein